MEIIVKLDDLLYERRMTLTDLAEKVGITLANLSILWRPIGTACRRDEAHLGTRSRRDSRTRPEG